MAISGARGGERNPEFYTRFLDTIGDGTGSIDMNIDGSVTPVDFMVTCPPNRKIKGFSFAIIIKDLDVWGDDRYGGLDPLPNGVTGFLQRVGEPRQDWFAQLPVRTNTDWLTYCHASTNSQFEKSVRFEYDFRKEGPGLHLYPGDYGGISINDDLTLLDGHFCRFGMTIYDYHIPTL